MKKFILSLSLASSLSLAYAQQSVSIGTTDTKTNAVLYLKGDGNQGLIIPVTSNHAGVPTTEGMIVYDKSDGKIYKCDGTTWTPVEGSGSGSDSQNLTINGNSLSISGGNAVPIAGAAPTQAGQLLMWDGSNWTTSSATVPTTGQVLKWNSTTSKWEAGTDNGTAYTAGTGISITTGAIANTGDTDATNDITTSSTANGDLTGTFPTLTISPLAVTSAKIAAGAVGLAQLASGPNNNVLTTDGTGKPTWSPGGSGVTSITATAPITTSGTAIAPIINFPSWPTNATGALTNSGTGTLSWQVPTASGTAGGDLTGTYPNPTVANNAITSTKIAAGAVGLTQLANGPNNNVLTTDGTGKPTWSPGGSGVTSITATAPITTSGTAIAPIINFPSWPTNATGALTNNGTGTLSWQVPTTSGAAGGDLSGTYPNPTIANGAVSGGTGGKITDATITGADLAANISVTTTGNINVNSPGIISGIGSGITAISATNIASGTLPIARGGTGLATVPTNGQVLIGNGANYTLSTLTAGSGIAITNAAGTITISNTGASSNLDALTDAAVTAPASGQVLVYNGTTDFQNRSLSGDVSSITSTGTVTLSNSASTRTNLGLGSFATLTNPMTAPFDMIIGGASGIVTKLPAPTTNQVLTSNGISSVAWTPQSNFVSATISQSANTVFAAPNGSAGAPVFRTLVDGDINAAAAIAGTKISPNFGAQNISTTGKTIFNTVGYTWPNAVGAANTVLQSDGTGGLAWATTPSPFTTLNVIPKGNGTTLVASQIFDSGTNVGIGTTGPTQLLDVFGGSINTNKDYMIGGTAVLKDGGSNVIVGDLTPVVTLGSHNSIFGSQAAQVMTGSATDNTMSGFQAGSGITTGKSNTFIGSKVGQNTTTGSFNTFIGSTTGLNHTTGSYNVLIGVGADITGAGSFTNSVAIGHNAYAGGNNVMALGGTTADAVNVGINTVTPTERLDVGGNVRFSGALMPNGLAGTGGQVLTSAGAGVAPTWATVGGNSWTLTGNTGTLPATNFIGTTDNVALKFKTNNSISGLIDPVNSNAFFGYIAGQTTTGQQNVAIGTNSLTSNTAGGRNTAVGTAALSNTTGSGNIGIGMSSLSTNTTGSNNTAIGFGADVLSGNLTNATAIGLNSKVAQSNAMALGGTGVDAVNVGINTTSPTERLDVVGNLKFSGTLMPNNSPGTPGQVLTSTGGTTAPTWTTISGSGWSLTGNTGTTSSNFIGTTDAQDLVFKTNGGEAFRALAAGGAVGFGTSAPEQRVDVNGYLRISTGPGGNATEGLLFATPSPGFSLIRAGGRATTEFQIVQSNNAPITFQTNNLERMRIDGAGNVGIGATPLAKMHLAGGALLVSGNVGTTPVSGAGNRLMWVPAKAAIRAGAPSSTEWDDVNIGLGSAAFGTNNTASGSNSTAIGQANVASGARSFAGGVSSVASGNGSTALGEGVTASSQAGFAVGHYNIGGGSPASIVGTDPVFEIGIGTSSVPANALTVLHNGNVGVGTNPTAAAFQVADNSAGYAVRFDQGATGDGFLGYVNTTSNTRTLINVTSNVNGFAVYGDGSAGIGASAPHASKLNVVNTITANPAINIDANFAVTATALIKFNRQGALTGSITESGGTVAYNAFTGSHFAHIDQTIERGMLVTLTGKNVFVNGHSGEPVYGVTPSFKANDPQLLGSYLSPLNDKDAPNIHQVMAVGNGDVWIVYNGEDLQIGDYLISSDIKGHAMKDIGKFDIAYIFARVAEPIKWSNIHETVGGVKHAKISVFYESFTRNNKAEKLQQEIDSMKADIERLKELIGTKASKD